MVWPREAAKTFLRLIREVKAFVVGQLKKKNFFVASPIGAELFVDPV